MLEPNPEQTAPIISNMFYLFLDQIVLKAYRTPHIPLDELPPLSDSDFAKHLVQKNLSVSFSFLLLPRLLSWQLCFQTLDPFRTKSKRRLFWKLLSVFCELFSAKFKATLHLMTWTIFDVKGMNMSIWRPCLLSEYAPSFLDFRKLRLIVLTFRVVRHLLRRLGSADCYSM